MRRLTILTALLAGLLLPGLAWADNTTSGGAYFLMVGGTPAEGRVSPTTPERWYKTSVRPGRSYCVETQGGVSFDSTNTSGGPYPVLTVYRSDAQTVVGTDDFPSSVWEPTGGARVCFVATVASSYTSAYVKVEGGPVSEAFQFRLRFVETTLFSNWYFCGGDYSAYTLLRNTTNVNVSYTINWRNLQGAIVAAYSGTLIFNGGTYVNGCGFSGALAAVSGTVEVVHTGSPGAIVASTTVLSPTTGLSFDAPFAGIMGRQPW